MKTAVKPSAPVWRTLFVWVASLGLVLAGCSSTAPPAPLPAARAQAMRLAADAAQLSAAENWPAAVRQWQVAADHYSLLNDPTNEAVAWHNLGQARRESGERTLAREAFEKAATMNQAYCQTDAWWRNQLALVQVDSDLDDTNAVTRRLTDLSARPVPPDLEGYFANEQARDRIRQGNAPSASVALDRAWHAFERDRDEAGLAAVAVNRAELFTRLSQYPAALAAWRQARLRYETLADPHAIAFTLLGEGETLLAARDDLARAERLLRQAARNFATLRRPEEQARALRGLIDCLRALNQSSEAERALLGGLGAPRP